MRIRPALRGTSFLFVAVFAQAQQTTSPTNIRRSTPITYEGRGGTIFSSGDDTYLFLDGESKSWEIVPVRQNDSSRFTLQANAAIYITLTEGQVKIVDTSDVTKTASLASPESAVTPAVAAQAVAGHAVIASGYVLYNGATDVSKARFILERTDETQDGARVYRLTMSESDDATTILKITGKDEASPREFIRKLPPNQTGQVQQIAYHIVDVFGDRHDGPFLSIGNPGIQSFSTRLTSASPYHQPQFPVHGDKYQNNQFRYHITVKDGLDPVLASPRLPNDLITRGSRVPIPLSISIQLPNFDYSREMKDGQRYRDWMYTDNQGNITYFKLEPEYKLQKGKDGPWTIKVSKMPFPLFDPKHPEN